MVSLACRCLQPESERADLTGHHQGVKLNRLIGPIPRRVAERAGAVFGVVSVDRNEVAAAVSPECGAGILEADGKLDRLARSHLHDLRGTDHLLGCVAVARRGGRGGGRAELLRPETSRPAKAMSADCGPPSRRSGPGGKILDRL